MPARAWLNDPDQVPYTQMRDAAVGLTAATENQAHAALFYREENGTLRALHFCWHHTWSGRRGEPLPGGYFWVHLGIRPSEALALASFCELVAELETLGEVPFAFDYDSSMTFDRTTGRLLGPKGEGLTCATFVLAMFASIGAKLVSDGAWPARPCDRWWQDRIMRQARPAHAEMLLAQLHRAEHGVVRYRPEEILAAAAATTHPVPFEVAIARGREALMQMGMTHLTCWNGACSGLGRGV